MFAQQLGRLTAASKFWVYGAKKEVQGVVKPDEAAHALKPLPQSLRTYRL